MSRHPDFYKVVVKLKSGQVKTQRTRGRLAAMNWARDRKSKKPTPCAMKVTNVKTGKVVLVWTA